MIEVFGADSIDDIQRHLFFRARRNKGKIFFFFKKKKKWRTYLLQFSVKFARHLAL